MPTLHIATSFKVLLATAAILVASACTSLPGATGNDAGLAEWRTIASSDPDTVVAQRQVTGGTISVLCSSDGCWALIVTDAQCELNTILPILVNTVVEAGITDGECIAADDLESGESIEGIIMLTETNFLLPNISLGDDATLAIPMADGSVSVIAVGMANLRKLIEPLKPGLFQAPGWLGEHGIDPAPTPKGTDERQWRGGLRAI